VLDDGRVLSFFPDKLAPIGSYLMVLLDVVVRKEFVESRADRWGRRFIRSLPDDRKSLVLLEIWGATLRIRQNVLLCSRRIKDILVKDDRMPYELPLLEPLGSQGWKVKIFDNEPPDHPHATVIFRTKKWRWKLREQSFMDDDPPPREVPKEIVAANEREPRGARSAMGSNSS